MLHALSPTTNGTSHILKAVCEKLECMRTHAVLMNSELVFIMSNAKAQHQKASYLYLNVFSPSKRIYMCQWLGCGCKSSFATELRLSK